MTPRGRLFGAAGIAAVLLSQTGVAAENDPATAKPTAAALPSLDELTATRERPLFSSTRRPAAAPAAAPAAPAPIAEATSFPFELVGIVLGPDIRIAVFRKGEAGPVTEGRPPQEEVRLKIGEKLGDWTVDEIAEQFVVMQGGAKRVRLRLFNEKNAGIEVGRPGSETNAAPAGQGDTEKQQAGPADDAQRDPVDEEILPSGTPKIVVPTPRTVVRPPPKPGQVAPQRPPRPPRPPGPPQQPR